MRNTETVTGKLEVLGRLNSSYFGNPRYEILLNGIVYRTKTNAALGYSIDNFDGKKVTATVGIHYGFDSVDSVKLQ